MNFYFIIILLKLINCCFYEFIKTLFDFSLVLVVSFLYFFILLSWPAESCLHHCSYTMYCIALTCAAKSCTVRPGTCLKINRFAYWLVHTNALLTRNSCVISSVTAFTVISSRGCVFVLVIIPLLLTES